MTLQQLAYLVAVAECGSITDAAERLFISQPSLSAAIHNLEKEMGVTAFVRSNKGVAVTREGEELLSFARMLLEQADIMQEHFGAGRRRDPRFCVSCQHYSFAVNAFVDVVQQYDADRYSFILRETQTGEIIDDVSSGRSELGLLYLCESNESVLSKLLRKNELVFEAPPSRTFSSAETTRSPPGRASRSMSCAPTPILCSSRANATRSIFPRSC
mgnify:CR=1 FL=1